MVSFSFCGNYGFCGQIVLQLQVDDLLFDWFIDV